MSLPKLLEQRPELAEIGTAAQAAALAVAACYLWEGTRRQRVKLAGNAVTPPAARDLIAAVIEPLVGAA